MLKLPKLSGKNLISILEKNGFKTIRVRGSHHFVKHQDGRCSVIPVHSNEDLGPGIIVKILRDLELTKEDLRNLMDKK